jgi:hypothetical protein
MFSELDRSYIRKYVGYGAVYVQAEPRLETAITTIQSQADGGSRPDSSEENAIKILIYGSNAVTGTAVTPGGTAQDTTFAQPALLGLLQIEQYLDIQTAFLGAGKADNDVTIDPARESARLRKEGRRLCHAMARKLGMKGVRADVFSASPVISDDDPFAYSDMEHWRGGP